MNLELIVTKLTLSLSYLLKAVEKIHDNSKQTVQRLNELEERLSNLEYKE